MTTPNAPERIALLPSGEVGIAWPGGEECFIAPRALRLRCPCAECIDELSRAPRLVPEDVPADVRIVEWGGVGSYAVAFKFSDGHATGIYTFDLLRSFIQPVDSNSSGSS